MVGLVEATTEHRETLEAVSRAVADLPSDFRAALLLRVNEGLSFREVAKILDQRLGMVKSRIRVVLRRRGESLVDAVIKS